MAEITKAESSGLNQNPSEAERIAQPGSIAEQARGVATQFAAQAKEVVTEKVHRSAERSADQLEHLADALRRSSGELKDSFVAPYVNKVADQVDRLADYVADAHLNDVVRSTEHYARKEPLIFLGGAFVLGIIGARFLKSSAAPPREEMH